MEKKKFVVPHVYILLLALILLFSLLSYIIPSNVYDYHDVVVNPETGQTRSVVDPETYHAVDPTPVSLMQFLTAVPRGMQESAPTMKMKNIIRADYILHFHRRWCDGGSAGNKSD